MSQFYFHKSTDGLTVPDPAGLPFNTVDDACTHAFLGIPADLTKMMGSMRDIFVATEVSDGNRVCYVVRGKITIEKR